MELVIDLIYNIMIVCGMVCGVVFLFMVAWFIVSGIRYGIEKGGGDE